MTTDVSVDVWSMVRAERTDLLDMARSLSSDQWDAQSLCTKWRVRDVIGHVIGSTRFEMSSSLLVQMMRCRFDVNEVIARDGIRRGNAPIAELLDDLEAMIGDRRLPPGVKVPAQMLEDALLHHADIRRPLGLQRRKIPDERVLTTLDVLVGYSSAVVNTKRMVAGLSFVATDIEWASGDGPEVRGPGEALALVLGGRPDGLRDLSGYGASILAARL